jgi:hypothetical protein
MQASGVEAITVIAGAATYSNGKRIADLALAHGLPPSHGFKETVQDGGLISVGPNLVAMARQGAKYISKSVAGAKPADLPVEQPSQHEERGWRACARMPSDLRAARSRTRAVRLPHRTRPDLSMLPARMLMPKKNRWRCSPTESLVRTFPPLNAGFRALVTQLWPNSVQSPVGHAKPT